MKSSFLTITLFLFAGLFNSPSYASQSTIFSYIQLAQSNQQSLNAATQSIKQKTGGRILSAKTVYKNGLAIYKIKVLLPSGKVQTFKISAQ